MGKLKAEESEDSRKNGTKKLDAVKDADICKYNPETTDAWTETGCSEFLEAWFAEHGTEDWLNRMDQYYHIKDGYSGLNCNTYGTNHCTAPQRACSEWDSSTFYFVRHLAARANSVFGYINENLQTSAIHNLAIIGQLEQDFGSMSRQSLRKVGEALRALNIALSFISALIKMIPVAGEITNAAAKTGFDAAGSALGITTASFSIVAAGMKDDDPRNFRAMEARALDRLSDMFKRVSDNNKDILAALFSGGNDELLVAVREHMASAGSPMTRTKYPIIDILRSGSMMVPVEDSEVVRVFDNGLNKFKATIVGKYVAQLQFYTMGIQHPHAEQCETTPGAVFLNTSVQFYQPAGCYYLLYKPRGEMDSQTARPEIVQHLTSKWQVDLAGFHDNIRRCNNKKFDARNGEEPEHDMSLQYPEECAFGLAYAVNTRQIKRPVNEGKDKEGQPFVDNEGRLPRWILVPHKPISKLFHKGLRNKYWRDKWNAPCDSVCKRKFEPLMDECDC